VGYFDAITSSAFKTTPDGERLFFPWGAMGRGYVLETEADYERLRRQIKISLIVGMVVPVGAIACQMYVLGLVTIVAWLAFYVAWMAQRLRSLQRSAERLTVREAMITQARTHSPILLWLGVTGSLLFVASGFFILIFNPRQWLTAGASILFFGFCGFLFARMIRLRRRSGGDAILERR
jgi:hypothetical protein